LVQWESADEQLLVEQHMRASGHLTKLYYWQGIRRTGAAEQFAYVDGSPLPQVRRDAARLALHGSGPGSIWDLLLVWLRDHAG
jgi:hypothetical protein